MPFTFAHPGFILPIKKWKPAYFSTTGLVFGSIAPDMDILLRLTNSRFHIFQYDLICVVFYIFPIAFLFAIYFHLVLRNILIDHLPAGLSEKLNHYKDFNYWKYLKKNLLKVILSIFIAIYLHLFLDLISHWNAMPFAIYGGNMYQSKIMSEIFFYGSIYLPPVILTLAGFYLILKTNNLRLISIIRSIPATLVDREKIKFYFVLFCMILVITSIKTYISGIEKAFIIDSVVIHLTNGCMLSGIITPTLFFIRNKIKKVS